MDYALKQLGYLCIPIKDYFWRQNENSSLTYTVKKRRSLLFEWSRPVSFLLDQNIFLTQFNLQTLECWVFQQFSIGILIGKMNINKALLKTEGLTPNLMQKGASSFFH